MQKILFSVLFLTACSREVIVESGGEGGRGGAGTTASSASTTSAMSSSSTGHLNCVIDIGECEVNMAPGNIGGLCHLALPETPANAGTCDNMGNCCKVQ